MKTKILTIFLLALCNAFLLNGVDKMMVNNSVFIYGKITTVDDETYQGQIRWGKEEAFWFDMFNSSKKKNENLKYLSNKEIDELNKKDQNRWSSNSGLVSWISSNWEWDNNDGHSHTFACQFGDIKLMEIGNRGRVILELKNGEAIKLQGGSNDIGTKVQIADEELGVIKLDWDRLSRVEFMETPSNLESQFGEPLFGTVQSTSGEFTGYLQWDHDERLTNDELNGDYEDGELDIKFGNIKSIRNIFRGSEVVLNSGRTFKLTGSNDVDDDNRGIIVNMPGVGRVDIPWDEFKLMEFENIPRSSNLDYNSFQGHQKIEGVVETTNQEKIAGEIIFDLDEKYTLEILDGVLEDIEYFFPFGSVKTIKPLNREESAVELINGEKFIFEDKVDVNENNDGVLVFMNEEYVYVPWNEVKLISFK